MHLINNSSEKKKKINYLSKLIPLSALCSILIYICNIYLFLVIYYVLYYLYTKQDEYTCKLID